MAKVIGNKSLYVKLNPTTSMTSVLKNEKSIYPNHIFLGENIRDWLSSYEKKYPISEFIKITGQLIVEPVKCHSSNCQLSG